jgi:hypothetical protein
VCHRWRNCGARGRWVLEARTNHSTWSARLQEGKQLERTTQKISSEGPHNEPMESISREVEFTFTFMKHEWLVKLGKIYDMFLYHAHVSQIINQVLNLSTI